MKLHEEKGAASVLVMLLLLALVVFGTAALTTSLANYRLTEKNVDWQKAYYQLEGEAEAVRADIISLGQEVSKMTLPRGSSDFYQELIKALNLFSDRVEYLNFEQTDEGLMILFRVSESDQAYAKHIDAAILSTYSESDGESCKLMSFKHSQEAFVIDEKLEFEDPFENPFEDGEDSEPFNIDGENTDEPFNIDEEGNEDPFNIDEEINEDP